MTQKLRVLHPHDTPRVESRSFHDDPDLRDQWQQVVGTGLSLLTENYWRLLDDKEAKAARAISLLMNGVRHSHPEFVKIAPNVQIGTSREGDDIYEASYLGLVSAPINRPPHPELTVARFIDATNEQLVALNSLYHLPR